MLNPCKQSLVRIVTLLLAAMPFAANASPTSIEQFDQQSWRQFQTTLPRPSVVVFTTTDCTHCPATIDKMVNEIKQRKVHAALVVVIMDGEGNQALLHDPHYQKANRLFEFSGQTPALQYSINPKWRGVTPYVALFARSGEPKLISGTPSTQDVNLWLAPGKKAQ